MQPEELKKLLSNLKEKQVKLVAVSKTQPPERVMQLYEMGQRIFGENKVRELTEKFQKLPPDIEWHMIGHLQRNKVKMIAPFVSMIHSVDSFRLLQEINKQAEAAGRKISFLFQMFIAREKTKFGLSEKELNEILDDPEFWKLRAVQARGLMGMATFTDDENVIRGEFRRLKEIFKRMKKSYFSYDENFSEISMGMSGDYKIAIQEGSTMVRLGTIIFGERA